MCLKSKELKEHKKTAHPTIYAKPQLNWLKMDSMSPIGGFRYWQ